MSIVFLVLFLAALVGQAIAGHADFNNDAQSHGDPTMSLGRYVLSSDFGSAVMENWQSEYLQFTLFILLTVWLVQRGSPESKELDKAGRESDQAQKVGPHAQQNSPRLAKVAGIRRTLYENSLVLVMGTFWLGHVACPVHHRSRAVQRGPARPPSGAAVSWSHYMARPTSGRTRSRTGSPSSWRWAPWRFSRCTCASVARPSRSRSGRLTTPRAWRAEKGVRSAHALLDPARD